jgi:hypothetical protein
VPFTRTGGPVPVAADQIVIVRSHLHPNGYGGRAQRGNLQNGFEAWAEMPADFAPHLRGTTRQPPGCRY